MVSMDPVFASHGRLPGSPLLRQQPRVAAPLPTPNLACHAAPNHRNTPPSLLAIRLTTRYGGWCLLSYLVSEDPRLHLLSKVLARVLTSVLRFSTQQDPWPGLPYRPHLFHDALLHLRGGQFFPIIVWEPNAPVWRAKVIHLSYTTNVPISGRVRSSYPTTYRESC